MAAMQSSCSGVGGDLVGVGRGRRPTVAESNGRLVSRRDGNGIWWYCAHCKRIGVWAEADSRPTVADADGQLDSWLRRGPIGLRRGWHAEGNVTTAIRASSRRCGGLVLRRDVSVPLLEAGADGTCTTCVEPDAVSVRAWMVLLGCRGSDVMGSSAADGRGE